MGRVRAFGKELFRRKVVRFVLGYLAVFWAVVAGLSQLQPVLEIPNTALIGLMVVGVAAVPLVAFLSWKYDIVPPQLVRDIKDVEAENPALSWARVRHDSHEAGYLLLSWVENDGKKIEKRFFQPVAIGREANNDIELGDERVSRNHAVLWAEDGVWRVRDLDSANGTYIGHARVSGICEIPASCDLRFHINGPIVSVHVARTAETRVG